MLRSRMLKSAGGGSGGGSGGGDMADFYALTETQTYSGNAPGQVYKVRGSNAVNMGASNSTLVGEFMAIGFALASTSFGSGRLGSHDMEDSGGTTLTNISGSPDEYTTVSSLRVVEANNGDYYDAENVISINSGARFVSEAFTIFNVANSSKSSYTTLTSYRVTSGSTVTIQNVSKHDVFAMYLYSRNSFSSITETSNILNVNPNDDVALFAEHPDSTQSVAASLVYAESDGTLELTSSSSFRFLNYMFIAHIS